MRFVLRLAALQVTLLPLLCPTPALLKVKCAVVRKIQIPVHNAPSVWKSSLHSPLIDDEPVWVFNANRQFIS